MQLEKRGTGMEQNGIGVLLRFVRIPVAGRRGLIDGSGVGLSGRWIVDCLFFVFCAFWGGEGWRRLMGRKGGGLDGGSGAGVEGGRGCELVVFVTSGLFL